MFTVKLLRHSGVEGPSNVKLVEAETVSIYPAGKPTTNGSAPQPCTNKIRGITIERQGKTQTFHVGDDESAIAEVDLYHCAFIENSSGATTERVYGY